MAEEPTPTEEQVDLVLEHIETMAETSPERMQKMKNIKEQLENGTYYVSDRELARRMLSRRGDRANGPTRT